MAAPPVQSLHARGVRGRRRECKPLSRAGAGAGPDM